MASYRILSLAIAVSAAVFGESQWTRHVIAENFHTFTAVAADFTGDGLPDVIANGGPGDQDVLFVAPDWKQVVLNRGIKGIHAAVLDVDRDGHADYVCARYSPGMIYWLRRPKNPHGPWSFHVLDEASQGGLDGVHGLLTGDVNRDGKPDLIANSGGSGGGFPNSLAWFEGPKLQRHIFAKGDAPDATHYLAIGDLNRDGRPDIATGSKFGHWFAWWEARRNPREVWRKHELPGRHEGATNVLIADWNQDGHMDVLGSRGHGKGLVLFEGPSWRVHEIGADLAGPHSLATGDLNGDGALDIVTCAKDSKVVVWFRNDGRGNFSRHEIATGQAGYDLRLVDMNGDRRLDILLAGQDSRNVVWFENKLTSAPAR